MARDLTHGDIKKHLMVMSIPTMFGFMAQTLYDLVDMMWIGQVSKEALAAVTIFSTIFWLFIIVESIITTSSVAMISQSYGQKQFEQTQSIIENTLGLKTVVAILTAAILSFLLKPLAALLTDDPVVLDLVMEYGRIRVFFLPILFLSFTVNSALRAIGDARNPMYLMLIVAFFNLVLDPILIFKKIPIIGLPGFGMGVFGAALATVIAISIAFLFGIWLLFYRKSHIRVTWKGLLDLDKQTSWKLLTIGIPTGIEMLFRSIAGAVILYLVSSYGTTMVSCVGIGNKLFGFVFMILLGLNQGGSAIVGQNLGAGFVDRVYETTRYALRYGFFIMLILVLGALLFPTALMRCFTSDELLISMGMEMIYIVAPSLLLMSLSLGIAIVFTGSGYNFPFLFSSLFARWCVQIPLILIAVYLIKSDTNWIWASYAIAEIIEFAVLLYNYMKGTWKTVKVV